MHQMTSQNGGFHFHALVVFMPHGVIQHSFIVLASGPFARL